MCNASLRTPVLIKKHLTSDTGSGYCYYQVGILWKCCLHIEKNRVVSRHAKNITGAFEFPIYTKVFLKRRKLDVIGMLVFAILCISCEFSTFNTSQKSRPLALLLRLPQTSSRPSTLASTWVLVNTGSTLIQADNDEERMVGQRTWGPLDQGLEKAFTLCV